MEILSSSTARIFRLKTALEKACGGAQGSPETGNTTTCRLAGKPSPCAGLLWRIKIYFSQQPDFAFCDTGSNKNS